MLTCSDNALLSQYAVAKIETNKGLSQPSKMLRRSICIYGQRHQQNQGVLVTADNPISTAYNNILTITLPCLAQHALFALWPTMPLFF